MLRYSLVWYCTIFCYYVHTMKFFNRGERQSADEQPDPLDAYRRFIGEIAAGNVEESEVIGLVLDALTGEDRLDLAETIVGDLPVSARLQLHRKVPMEEVIAEQDEKERRPSIIADMIAYGHDDNKIDFGLVPTEAELMVELHDMGGRRKPDKSTLELTLKLQSLGHGVYQNMGGLILQPEHIIDQDGMLELQRADTRAQGLTTIGIFGQRLGFMLGDDHLYAGKYSPWQYRRPNDGPIVNLSLGQVMLEGQAVFNT